jgi:hypothetical protein
MAHCPLPTTSPAILFFFFGAVLEEKKPQDHAGYPGVHLAVVPTALGRECVRYAHRLRRVLFKKAGCERLGPKVVNSAAFPFLTAPGHRPLTHYGALSSLHAAWDIDPYPTGCPDAPCILHLSVCVWVPWGVVPWLICGPGNLGSFLRHTGGGEKRTEIKRITALSFGNQIPN